MSPDAVGSVFVVGVWAGAVGGVALTAALLLPVRALLARRARGRHR